MNKLVPLESLRGLLALWVVVGHVVSLTFSDQQLSKVHLGLLNQPILAVDLFIILSGFVIFFLLDNSRLSFGAFLIRRFFRLWPLYLVVLSASALTLMPQLTVVEALPWRNPNIVSDIAIHNENLTRFWENLIPHLILLQGIVPLRLLPFSDYTFVAQAWSISLEWQFYLIAPLIYWLLRTKRWKMLCVLAAAFTLLRYLNYNGEAFIGNQFGLFAVGITSYYIFKHGRTLTGFLSNQIDFMIFASVACLYFFLPTPWPLIVWALVLSSITLGQRSTLNKAVNWVLNLRFLKWLGQISYSIYLNHMLILYAVFAAILRFDPMISQSQFIPIALSGTIVGTIVLSAVTYYFVEVPGIHFGKQKKTGPLAEVSLKATP